MRIELRTADGIKSSSTVPGEVPHRTIKQVVNVPINAMICELPADQIPILPDYREYELVGQEVIYIYEERVRRR